MTTARDWELRCRTCGTVRDADAAGMMFVGHFRWPNRLLVWCSGYRRFRCAAMRRKTRGFTPIVRGAR